MIAVIAASVASAVLDKVARISNVKAKANKISNAKATGKRGEEIATIAIVAAAGEMVAMKAHKVMIVTTAQKQFLNRSAMIPLKLRATSICVMRATASCALVDTSPRVRMPTSPSSCRTQ
jgi:hypothetical protein